MAPVFARDGVAGECQANLETVVIADVDLELLRQNRLNGTVRTWHDRRTDLYEVVAKSPGEVGGQPPGPVSTTHPVKG